MPDALTHGRFHSTADRIAAPALSHRLRRLFFVHGPSEMARYRGWYRQILWADRMTRGGLGLALRALLKTPARRLREAREGVDRYGKAGVDAGVSTTRQLLHLWWLGLWHGTMADTYYRFRLYAPDPQTRADRLVQKWEAARIYRVLAAGPFRTAADMLADKRAYARWCEAHGVPTVPTLRTFTDGRMDPLDHPAPLPEADLFSKTAFGYGGAAAARWRWSGEGRWTRGGTSFTEAELLARLAADSAASPLVLQPSVRNHRALSALVGHALSTARVVTIRLPGEEPRVLRSVFRIGATGAEMDNFTQGGMVAAVDLADGRLSRAIAMSDEDLRPHFHAVHPGTGAPIEGVQLPCWPEVLTSALRAHAAIGEFPCIGWDVAILDDGPVLLEGNWNPGVLLSQLPSGLPLGNTDYVRCFNAYLSRHLAAADWAAIRRDSTWEPHGGTNRWMGEQSPLS